MLTVNVLLDNITNDIKAGEIKRASLQLFTLVDGYKAIALEHTVECQCGKRS